MEFANRPGQQPAAQAPRPTASRRSNRGKWLRVFGVGLLVCGALIVAGVTWLISNGAKSEADHLNKDKFQAVFLNGGQVYFGKIRDLNGKYMTLDNIYYLRVNEAVQPDADADKKPQQDISLAKLGCELHGPEDRMVINRDQVTFWENLKDDGQVAKAIAEFVKQNPDGQKCSTPQAESNSQPSNNE